MNNCSLAWLCCIYLLFCSCSQLEVQKVFVEHPLCETKSANSIDYSVTKQDVEAMLYGKTNIVRVNSYPKDEAPTLFVVSCSPGFFIISADKRAFPIVAYSSDGFFIESDDETYLEVENFILEEYSDPVRSIMRSTDLTPEMELNISRWHNIREQFKDCVTDYDSRSDVIRSKQLIERKGLSVSIGPLLSTSWGQADHYTNDHYWNYYCPWSYSSCAGSKSPVGCVAVAGGQFGYYMRDMDGVAIRIPTEASCHGYVGNYSRTFSNHMSISWIDEMPWSYSNTTAEMEHARIFLAYIGESIDMDYGATYSSAYTSDLTTLFDTWGIDSDYVSFTDSSAISQLNASIPVVTRGSSSFTAGGHCWVIDGYQIDSDTGVIYYHMNWGWNGSYNGWFSSGNWLVAGLNYNYGKHMIRVN